LFFLGGIFFASISQLADTRKKGGLVRVFSHWISSSVKNIQAHSGLTPYLFGNAKKGGECDIFLTEFHPALKTFKPIRA
jgi:hypothetical protein